mgnify:CR=1 FL=1
MPNNPLNLYTSQILQDELAKQAREKPGQLTLDEAHLAQLLGLVNEERGPRSPLPGIQRQKLTDPAFINLLVDKGWLVAAGKDGKLHPTAHSRRAVLGLLKPNTSIQLVLGSLTELSISALYSAEGYRKDALVIYTHKTEEDRYVVHPALSPSDLSDALLAHLLIGPREGLGFEFSLMQRPMLAYLAVLDLVYTRRMEAKLRAELMPQLNFSTADLLARFPEIAGVGEPHRPGIVHRLDVGTSGLLAVARTQRAYHSLVDALAARDVGRVYRALVWGHLANPVGVVDAPIGRDHRDAMRMAVVVDGKPARTRYRVLREYRTPTESSALECRLETGRTHQIRVHLAAIGHPVVGDGAYGGIRTGITPPRPFLHAAALELVHPVTGEVLQFHSPLPADLADVEAALGT